MLPQNLLRVIALDLLCAIVPSHHPPLGVQQENGVVLDALDQQAETLFARF
jgi:hypothetical protein